MRTQSGAFFLMAVILAFAPSCASSGDQLPASLPATIDASATPTALEPLWQALSQDELAYLRRFAEAYEPRSGREVIPSPPVPDEHVTDILAKAAKTQSREHEKYVFPIFLRLSRFQLEHFKQGYELGRTNPLTVELYRLIGVGRKDYLEAELMEPYIANLYVRQHPDLREYLPIDREMRRYDAIAERMKIVR